MHPGIVSARSSSMSPMIRPYDGWEFNDAPPSATKKGDDASRKNSLKDEDAEQVKSALERLYMSPGISVDSLRTMSQTSTHPKLKASMRTNTNNDIVLPMISEESGILPMDCPIPSSATGQATRCFDRSYTDRRGRKVNVYTSCMPAAQKDYGVRTHSERHRVLQGVHQGTTRTRTEMSNADLPMRRDARDDPTIGSGIRAQRAVHETSASYTNRGHARETSDFDSGRDKNYYSGYNLKQGHETRTKPPACRTGDTPCEAPRPGIEVFEPLPDPKADS